MRSDFGYDVATRKRVTLEADARRQGLYLIGKTGTGKTSLIEDLVVQDLDLGLGVCVLDPHGDLVEAILARVPVGREHDVIDLNLADTAFPFGLNLYECADLGDPNLISRVASQSVEIFEKLWGPSTAAASWGPRVAQILLHCAYTLIENPGYTMVEIPRLLLDREFRARLTSNLKNDHTREFWELQFNTRGDRDLGAIVESTLNKVDGFLTPTVRPIAGFGRTTIEFRKAMDQGKVILVRLAAAHVGQRPAALIGTMMVSQIFNAALSRQDTPPSERRQFNLYADEYQRFSTPAFAEMLAEARKYALATTLAHQFRGQLEDEANRGATLNAGNMIVFAVHGEDAQELAKQFSRKQPPPAVVGQRPKLSVSQDPIGHLSRNGHQDKVVRDITRAQVHHWVRLRAGEIVFMSELSNQEWMAPVYMVRKPTFGQQPYISSDPLKAYLKEGIQLTHTFLVKRMEGAEPSVADDAVVIGRIVEKLRRYIGCRQLFNDLCVPLDFSKEEFECIVGVLRSWIPRPNLGNWAACARPLVDMRELFWRRSESSRWDKPARQRAMNETALIGQFVFELHRLGTALAAEPILVDNGQWEPIYDRPRTFADLEAEIASELVDLPKYTARMRLGDGDAASEHTARTPEYRQRETGPEIDRKLDRIRERTRLEYCEPVEEVRERIRLRRTRGNDHGRGTARRVPL